MRLIVLDTETTGLDPKRGDRVVEIGCVELRNHVPTQNSFQRYLNPERDMPEGAFAVHGLSSAFLADKPLFVDVADEFLAFIGDAPVIAHNAGFDVAFLNAELEGIGREPLSRERVIDTVALARRKFPGASASLDALCRRFGIDLAERQRDGHGALIDARLLADVYLFLVGGRQARLELAAKAAGGAAGPFQGDGGTAARPPRPHAASAEERSAHEAFVNEIKKPIWRS